MHYSNHHLLLRIRRRRRQTSFRIVPLPLLRRCTCHRASAPQPLCRDLARHRTTWNEGKAQWQIGFLSTFLPLYVWGFEILRRFAPHRWLWLYANEEKQNPRNISRFSDSAYQLKTLPSHLSAIISSLVGPLLLVPHPAAMLLLLLLLLGLPV